MMVTDRQVMQWHEKLKVIRDNARQHGISKHVLDFMDVMIGFTNVHGTDEPEKIGEPECKHETIIDGECSKCHRTIESLRPQLVGAEASGEHKHVATVFGTCACGQCMHPRVQDGQCLDCGEETEVVSPVRGN